LSPDPTGDDGNTPRAEAWCGDGETSLHGRPQNDGCRHQLIDIYIYTYLVGGLEHVLFFHILGIILPFDKYFSEGLKPPTSIYIYIT